MERPSTPPAPSPKPTGRPPSPPTPEVTRRIEENRLRAKALRAERDAASLAAGTAPPPRTSAGLVTTGDIQLAGRKRGHGAISRADVPAAHRDARTNNNSSGGEKGEGGGPLKAAKSFAKYVDYNFSAMTDTKGGFLSAEDDPRGRGGAPASGQVEKPAGVTAAQWEKEQLHRNLRRLKAGPYEPGLSVLAEEQDRKKCRECASLEIDFVWDEVFKTRVCNACKEKMPEKYSLLTKTEAKEDYLLTEPELKDGELLPHLSRPNPHKSHWHDMMLFLRYQVEEYAFGAKWGSAEALDAEFAKRQADKKRRKEAKFKDKLLELKKKTMTESFRRNFGRDGKRTTQFGEAIGREGRHVHDWGQTVENADGMTVKTCLECGMEVEELEL